MSIKAVVLDLDGTLLSSDHTILPETKEYLINIQKQGTKVILASGRPTYGMMKVAEQLKLKEFGSYLVSFNGGQITKLDTNEILFEESLSKEDLRFIYNISKEENVGLLTFEEGHVLTPKKDEYIEYEAMLNGLEIVENDDFYNYVNFQAVKCIMTAEPTYLKEVEEKLQVKYPQYNITRSQPFFLEFTKQGIDKANALGILFDKIGIAVEDSIAFGDGNNDRTMIEFCGIGVAMDNANPKVKEIADETTLSNDANGIVHTLKKYL
jgi:Cof subfamily protein (haloacid dehalogenase superfamily)